MNTIIIGDLHLQSQKIIPLIKTIIDQYNVKRIVFIGDYVDQWGQTGNDDLYLDELNNLINFKDWCNKTDIIVEFLLGNHDVPYLIYKPQHYSSDSKEVREIVNKKLLELNPKIYTIVEDYVVSHAGFISNLKVTNDLSFENLDKLEQQDGHSFGQSGIIASPIWARPTDHMRYPSHHYKKQIFGHTPTETIQIGDLINVDTFSLTPSLNKIGDGSILLINKNKIKKIQTNWNDVNSKTF